MTDVVDLCLRHLSRLRSRAQKYCYYLIQHEEILIKLATVIEHYEINWLHDEDVENLTAVLHAFLKNKLKSFSLSSYQTDNEECLRTLLKALAKSHGTDNFRQYEKYGCKEFCSRTEEQNTKDDKECLTQSKDSVIGIDSVNDNRQFNKEADHMRKHTTKEDTILKSKPFLSENLKEHIACFSIENQKCHSSLSRCDSSTSDMGNNIILHNDLKTNTLMSKLEKDKQDDEELYHSYSDSTTEDYLYEDIFSRHNESQDGCCENDGTRIDSSSLGKSSVKRELDLTSHQIHSHCLSELRLFSCLMDNKSLKVFSEELLCFVGLQSLTLCDVGMCSFPAMYDLISSIKELVTHCSLQRLGFENCSLTFDHANMFYDLLVLSCKNCGSTNKGLLRLGLVGDADLSLDRLGEQLSTCSFCEKSVPVCGKPGRIFFSACECLKGGFKRCDKSALCSLCNQSETLEVGHGEVDPLQNNVMMTTESSSSSKRSYITSGLQSLHLSGLRLERLNSTVFASSLLRNRSLRSISLPSCGLMTQDIASIFDCISGRLIKLPGGQKPIPAILMALIMSA